MDCLKERLVRILPKHGNIMHADRNEIELLVEDIIEYISLVKRVTLSFIHLVAFALNL